MSEFERGKIYHRGRDIHTRYRGNTNSGIIYGPQSPYVFATSGAIGPKFGYENRFHADGRIDYFGEGQVGPMQMDRGNLAILNHAKDGKSLLFFRKEKVRASEREKGDLRFLGEMVCEGWHHEPAADRNGDIRQAIVFELRPLDWVVEAVDEAVEDTLTRDLSHLRSLAMAAAAPSHAIGQAARSIFQRSADVRNYVLARASGTCEGCDSPAPFIRRDGRPYLEPHHTRRASDGGPDDPRHVIAVCPNCHRRVHSGMDGEAYNEGLKARLRNLEPQ